MNGLLLAIDTSTSEGSIALAGGGTLLGERSFRTHEGHSASLLPEIHGLMADVDAVPADLGGVVIAAGPGSFTGLRVAAATAKGLVHARKLELFAYSTLLSIAGGAAVEVPVCALLDARRDEVFRAVYRVGSQVEVIAEPAVRSIDQVLREAPAPAVFAGPGATRHRGRIMEASGAGALPEAVKSTARVLLDLARYHPRSGRVTDFASWEPEYLRASGAERIRAAATGG